MKLSVKRTVFVGFAFLAVSMFWENYNAFMPLMLSNFDGFKNSAGSIGLIISLGNVIGIILLPLMGKISDHTKSKFGRRMPFIIIGLIMGSMLLLLLNFAHEQHILWLLLTSAGLLLIFMWSCRAPAVALMPDITPKPVRSKANAVINLMGGAGGVIATVASMVFKKTTTEEIVLNDMPAKALATGSQNWLLFGSISILMILAAILLVFKVKENKLVEQKEKELADLGYKEDDKEEQQEHTADDNTKRKLLGLNKAQIVSFGLLLVSIVFWFIAYTGSRTFFSLFVFKYLGLGGYETPLMVALAAGFIAFVPAGILGEKIGRKKTILIGICVVAAGFLAATVAVLAIESSATVMIVMYICFVLVGAGWAIINVHSFVMAVEMSNKKNVGTFTGIYYFASMTGQIIAPLLTGAIVDMLGGITGGGLIYIFPFSLIFMGLAFATMIFVKHGNAKKPEIKNETEPRE